MIVLFPWLLEYICFWIVFANGLWIIHGWDNKDLLNDKILMLLTAESFLSYFKQCNIKKDDNTIIYIPCKSWFIYFRIKKTCKENYNTNRQRGGMIFSSFTPSTVASLSVQSGIVAINFFQK